MRFSYIDSRGEEVPLDSVEALALRVQIGVIRSDTRLYDASADRWAPAEEHPIYQNLVSSAGTKDRSRPSTSRAGPEAPSGGAQAPSDPGEAAEPPSPEEPIALPPDAPASEEPIAEPVQPDGEEGLPAAGEKPAPGPAGAGALDWEELTGEESEAAGEVPAPVIDEPPAEEDAAPAAAEDEALEDEGPEDEDFEEFDLGELTLDPAEELESPAAAESGEEAESADEDDVSFDVEGGLQLEEQFADTAADPGTEAASDAGVPVDEPPEEPPPAEPGSGEAETPEETPEETATEGLELTDMAGEMEWADEEADAEEEPAGAVPQRIRDPNPFGPEVPPEEEPAALSGEAAASASGPASEGEGELEEDVAPPAGPAPGEPADVPAPPRSRAPRPEHWERRSVEARRSRTPLLLAGLLVLAILGGGGWYLLAGPGAGGAAETAEATPPPPLPEGLVPVKERIGDAAYAGFMGWVREVRESLDLPAGSGPEWLEGRYFAQASGYPQVRLFWDAWRGFLDRLRSGEEEAFRAAVERSLEAEEGLDAGAVPILRERLAWEFDRAWDERDAVYRPLETLSEAALDFHELLVRREDEIRYDPGSSGLSQDPILEVVVSDALLRSEMNERIDRVLRSIAEVGASPPLTADGLLEILEGGLREANPYGG